jgi:hypothetical protein
MAFRFVKDLSTCGANHKRQLNPGHGLHSILLSFFMMKMEVSYAAMRFSYRLYSCVVLLSFAAVASAHAQIGYLRKSDVAVSAFGQFSPDVTGNGITDDPTRSAGGQAAFRHSYHWWLGYEGSYNYTRFAEVYSTQRFPIQHNTHEFAASYLASAPIGVFGIHPFALAGVSALIFSPTLNGGQNVSWQGKPALNFGAGVNCPILTKHLGLRLQYRGVYANAPDFNEAVLKTGKSRLTSEPMAGVYLKF